MDTDALDKKISAVRQLFSDTISRYFPLYVKNPEACLFVENAILCIYRRSLEKWADTKSASQAKFVLPKKKDIAFSACFFCALSAANGRDCPAYFPLDAIRCTYLLNNSHPTLTSYTVFRRRALDFVCVLQENRLNVLGTGTVPTFDYEVFLAKLLRGAFEQDVNVGGYLRALLRHSGFDSKSPYICCVYLLYHIVTESDCACGIGLTGKAVGDIRKFLNGQCELSPDCALVNDEQLSEANEQICKIHNIVYGAPDR